MVSSSSADVTRAFRRCFRGGSVYVSLRFIWKRRKTSHALGNVVFDILNTSKGALALAMFW